MTLSDRVVIMNVGKIQQVGTPQEIYAYPNNHFVADFIGKANFLTGKVNKILSSKKAEVEVKRNIYRVALHNITFKEGEKILLLVRPEAVNLKPKIPNSIIGKIQQIIYLGSHLVYEIKVDDNIFTVEISNPLAQKSFTIGEEVSLCLKENSLHVLPYEDIKKQE
jgi:iron(III) transport system ATP-binding protein